MKDEFSTVLDHGVFLFFSLFFLGRRAKETTSRNMTIVSVIVNNYLISYQSQLVVYLNSKRNKLGTEKKNVHYQMGIDRVPTKGEYLKMFSLPLLMPQGCGRVD